MDLRPLGKAKKVSFRGRSKLSYRIVGLHSSFITACPGERLSWGCSGGRASASVLDLFAARIKQDLKSEGGGGPVIPDLKRVFGSDRQIESPPFEKYP